MKRTEEQIEIHEKMANEEDNLMINAVAGSGKTTVLVSGCRFLPRNSRFITFNKAIATELKTRLPEHIEASTFNAMGYAFLRDRLHKGLRVKAFKTYDLIDKYCPQEDSENRKLISQLVGAAKSAGVGIEGLVEDSIENWETLAENYDIKPDMDSSYTIDNLVKDSRKVLSKNEDDLQVIDFDDQLYLSLKFMIERGWKPRKHEVILVDEAQDTSMVQAHLLEYFAKRIIMVGDKFQAIYGFRGAGVDSMGDLARHFSPIQLSLSRTFRCPRSVVALAQSCNPEIQARDGAPEGTVTYDRDVYSIIDYLDKKHLVLCRNNFPLISVALQLLKNKIPFSMSGSYPKQLMNFIKSFKAQHLQMLRVRLLSWWDERKEELEEKNRMSALEREDDKVKSLLEMVASSTSMDDMFDKLERMTVRNDGPVLSSIHSAKGLEAEVVHFLLPELIPSKYAVKDWQLRQEDNLYYVGVTRSKSELHFYSKEN